MGKENRKELKEMEKRILLPVISLNRHRMGIDGNGVTTLVAAFGCPLSCQYCLNPMAWDESIYPKCTKMSPQELYEKVKIDSLYFKATGGGVTFGGGEALLHTDFIRAFKPYCEDGWNIAVETSLHVPKPTIQKALEVVDEFIIDVKAEDKAIYQSYTGQAPMVWDNLELFRRTNKKVTIKVPYIEGYTTTDQVHATSNRLKAMGFDHILEIVYLNKEEIANMKR